MNHQPHHHDPRAQRPGRTGLVVVASTRAAAGVYEDTSGPYAVEFLRGLGFETPAPIVVADRDIATMVDAIFARPTPPNVLLTSGGTGITPDDRTVEAVAPHLERELPGVVHAFWEESRSSMPTAVLSRAIAGVTGHTFAMTLPGSRGGVADGCRVLADLLIPILNLLEGDHEH